MTLVPLLIAFCALSVFDVWGTEPDKRQVPEIFPEYRLLERSTGSGALLELPQNKWVHPHAIRRMYWQPKHGRPIADGYTGFMPAWHPVARNLYNRFPSKQCLALLRVWNIDTVLTEPAHSMHLAPLPAGVQFRGTLNGWRLYDLELSQFPLLEHEQAPERSREVKPVIYMAGEVDTERTSLLTDSNTSFRSAVSLTRSQWMVFRAPEGEGSLAGIVLDFGYGAFFRIPDEVVVEARINEIWQRIDVHKDSKFIGAQSADLLMNSQFARVFIPLQKVDATVYRLRGKRRRWDLPEMRLVVGIEAEQN